MNPHLKRLTNHSEHRVYEQLAEAAERFGAQVYRKIRVADVININLSSASEDRTYALMSHFDFVVSDEDHVPEFAIEFDGPGHSDTNDAKKDNLSLEARFCLIRIDLRASRQSLEEMTLLRYLVDVWFMSKEFLRRQQSGEISADEPFMMWAFLEPGAKHIFDSKYNFILPAQRAIAKLNQVHRFISHNLPWLEISHVRFGDGKGRFVAYSAIPVGRTIVFGRYGLDLSIPSEGGLNSVMFGGLTALSDFAEGGAHREMVENVRLQLDGAGHVLLTENDVASEIRALKEQGFRLLGAGYGSANPFSEFTSFSDN